MRLDLLHLLRSLRRSPASAGAAILTLSLTPGAGASIFAVVDAVLLTPPPVVGRLALEQFGGVANRDVAVSWRVIGVVSIVAAASAWIWGSLPALVASRRSIVDVLRRGATSPPHELALRRVFVTGEVALAFVLLVGFRISSDSD